MPAAARAAARLLCLPAASCIADCICTHTPPSGIPPPPRLQLRVLWLNCVAFLWSTFLILRSSGVASRPALLAAAVKLK